MGSTNEEQYYPEHKVGLYTLMDAIASSLLNGQLDIQVNMTNLTNEKHLSTCSFYCYSGTERAVDLCVSYKWSFEIFLVIKPRGI